MLNLQARERKTYDVFRFESLFESLFDLCGCHHIGPLRGLKNRKLVGSDEKQQFDQGTKRCNTRFREQSCCGHCARLANVHPAPGYVRQKTKRCVSCLTCLTTAHVYSTRLAHTQNIVDTVEIFFHSIVVVTLL